MKYLDESFDQQRKKVSDYNGGKSKLNEASIQR